MVHHGIGLLFTNTTKAALEILLVGTDSLVVVVYEGHQALTVCSIDIAPLWHTDVIAVRLQTGHVYVYRLSVRIVQLLSAKMGTQICCMCTIGAAVCSAGARVGPCQCYQL